MDQVWSEVFGRNYNKRPNQYNEKTRGMENSDFSSVLYSSGQHFMCERDKKIALFLGHDFGIVIFKMMV